MSTLIVQLKKEHFLQKRGRFSAIFPANIDTMFELNIWNMKRNRAGVEVPFLQVSNLNHLVKSVYLLSMSVLAMVFAAISLSVHSIHCMRVSLGCVLCGIICAAWTSSTSVSTASTWSFTAVSTCHVSVSAVTTRPGKEMEMERFSKQQNWKLEWETIINSWSYQEWRES